MKQIDEFMFIKIPPHATLVSPFFYAAFAGSTLQLFFLCEKKLEPECSLGTRVGMTDTLRYAYQKLHPYSSLLPSIKHICMASEEAKNY